MSCCSDCGKRTTRRGRCRQCAIIHVYDGDSQPQPDTRESGYECTSCGKHYITDGSDPCPDCGARRRRYLGEVVTDGGQPDEESHISKSVSGGYRCACGLTWPRKLIAIHHIDREHPRHRNLTRVIE